jgi:hypothetical protein
MRRHGGHPTFLGHTPAAKREALVPLSLGAGQPPPELPGGPLVRFLLDPWAAVTGWATELAAAAGVWLPRIALTASLWVALAAGCWVAADRRRTRRLGKDARFVAILPPPAVEPAAAEALWANLAGLLRQRRPWRLRPHVAFELHWTVQGLVVGLWVPGMVAPRLVERAVEAAWPGARADTQAARPPLPQAATGVLAGQLRLATPWLPLRTDHWADPLRGLLGAAGELAAGEVAVVQVLARPAGGRYLVRARTAARRLAVGRGSAPLVGRLLDLATPGPGGRRRQPTATAADPGRAADARLLLAKLAGPCWEVAVRYGVATTAEQVARGRLRARAHALQAAFAVYAGRNRLLRRRLAAPAGTLATRPLRRGDLLATGELAALAHLPADPAVPGLARAGARPVPLPPGAPAGGKVLGDAEIGARRPLALQAADACYHTHLLGATGSGKSTLIANLALTDITAGRGVVVVDPKGDLVTDLLDRMPGEAVGRVVLLDPDEQAAPPTMNVLDGDDPDLAVDHLVGILHRIWIAHWGPRIDDVLRASCLTLLRRPGATLADVPRLLADPGFRRPYLAGLDDPIGLGGFWAWYQSQSPASQAQMIGPIMTRLRAFLLRGFVRAVVGSATSSFDMAEVLDGGVLLVRVPKGLLGDDTSRLLGSFVVARVWQAATARARTGQQLRTPASLYVDECQNFLTLPYRLEELLPEARGYGLALHLAHQHLGQLPPELYHALSANARTKVYFTCSPEDARLLERHVTPHLSAHDLAHLGAYQAAVRLVADGSELPACTVRTRPAPDPIPGRANQVRAAARARFGRTEQQRRQERLRRELTGGDDPRLPGPIPVATQRPTT